jgi:hypothetical protein
MKWIQTFEKMMLKSWDKYAEIISAKYDELPIFDKTAVHHWKSLNDSNKIFWKRLITDVNVIFVSGDEKYRLNPTKIEVMGKDYDLIFWEGGQPYSTQPEMKADFEQNGRMYISVDYSDHPVFTMEENIIFRSVHDRIVHVQGNYPFGLKGELQSYNLHAKLAPKNALPALFTEVVGQVCQCIVKGDFPVQKVAVIQGVDFYKVGAVDGMDIDNKELKVEPVKKFNDFENPTN